MNLQAEKQEIARALAALGVHAVPQQLVRIAHGANNRAYRLTQNHGEPLLVKRYFWHPGDRRDRLGAEFRFLEYAWASGIRAIPQPRGCLPDARLGVYEFVAGRKTVTLDDDALAQAAEFYLAVNAARNTAAGSSLPHASEACFNLAAHLECINRRIERLAGMPLNDQISAEALSFVKSELLPAWEKLQKDILVTAADKDIELAPGQRCISPSDFGFHNAIQRPDGRYCFIDFEYAGWDDPAKTIADFFCQPQVPVPTRYLESFAAGVAGICQDPGACLARTRLLLPAYALKWCCIMLNEFLPVGNERRRHAGKLGPARRAGQLAKAKAYFAERLSVTGEHHGPH